MVRWYRGFTLIEMLVVIAIMGVLAALIMPNMSRVREQAWTKRCASNLKQLHAGMAMKATEGGYYCRGASYLDDVDRRHTGWIHWPDWDTPGYTFIGPDGEMNIRGGDLWKYMGNRMEVYACPTHVKNAAENNVEVVRSYAMHSDLCGEAGTAAVNALALRDASRKIMFGEPEEARLDKEEGGQFVGSFFTSTNEMAFRHKSRANVVFVDGHLEARP